ncbi:class I SAM-dependent methyltransferase [Tsuneonella amylolytica]|uniref:class I SAM-dependent methyltransferase n=1 Tax=Tsuneonella amylolytica TaxID=2338327 RepID=UPI000EA8E2A4|nr:methyltransferase domain-containing protein [Tsuneonella amylolytica]
MKTPAAWHSPISGKRLVPDTPHSLGDGEGERWPVVDGIAYLRTGRGWLVAEALALLDDGDGDGALVALLADQDPWWKGAQTDRDELRRLVAERDSLTLREAMGLLRFGAVADYFAHRWSDPTYLAGLALLEAHWTAPETAFELAGGIGHYARALGERGVRCTSADIVFAKCWLARHWVAPDAEYAVFDAGDLWPIGDRRFDLVHCQDAFYFLPSQEEVADRLRSAVGVAGTLAVGHLHNADVAGGAMGPARTAGEWQALFPQAHVYDERALRRALLRSDTPVPCDWERSPAVEAWAIAETCQPARAMAAGVSVPPGSARLVANPLIGPHGPVWPSPRYEAEYGPEATWTDPASPFPPERDRRRVALPERW